VIAMRISEAIRLLDELTGLFKDKDCSDYMKAMILSCEALKAIKKMRGLRLPCARGTLPGEDP